MARADRACGRGRSGRRLKLPLVGREPLGARLPRARLHEATALAPAKINRELRVGRIRPDGYHEIRSRMVSIDLADRLTAKPPEGPRAFRATTPRSRRAPRTSWFAPRELLAGRRGSRRARADPREARADRGRAGGGSSDAAVALLLLDRLWDLETPQTGSGASRPGSEATCPFFLTGGEADVSGRGEIVTPVEDSPAADLLLLVPPFSISTADVYRLYAGRRNPAETAGNLRVRGRQVPRAQRLGTGRAKKEPRMEAFCEPPPRSRRTGPSAAPGPRSCCTGSGRVPRSASPGSVMNARVSAVPDSVSREYRARVTAEGGLR